MSFFNKLKEGLAKTKGAIDNRINNVFANFRKVDEDLLEELEEALILSDVGATTATNIIDDLRLTIKRNKIEEAELVKAELRREIAEVLNSNDSLNEQFVMKFVKK